jgi:hypothetical protein
MRARHAIGSSKRTRDLALTACVLGVLAACGQNDVIAREALRAGADGGAPACTPLRCAGFDTATPACASPSARIAVGDGCSGGAADVPVSRFALCSCTDFVTEHALTTLAWDSSAGPTDPAAAASVAINGSFTSRGALDVQGELFVGGPFSDGNAGQTVIDGVSEHAASLCACDDGSLLDVSALVAARKLNNDNLQLTFDAAALAGFTRTASDPPLELACGRYYAAALSGSGDLRMHVQGHVELFIDGEVALDNDFIVRIEPGSSLDLFIAGNVRVGGKLALGAPEIAPAMRVYVGGKGTLDLTLDALIAGPLYAPRAELVPRAGFETYGALFVRRAALGGDVVIHYDVAEREPLACALL